MMIYLLEASICLVMFYGLYHIVFKDTQAHNQNRLYLLGSLIASILIPLLSIPIYKNVAVFSSPINQPVGVGAIATPISSSNDWNTVLVIVYLLGVIISFFVILKSLYKLIDLVRNGESIKHHDTKVIYSNSDVTLCSFGSYIIAPNNRKGNLTEYELTHELNHIRSFHTLDILFIKIFRSFFWFNPILKLYENRLIEVHEYQADASTQDVFGKDSYISFLVDQVSTKYQSSLVHNFNSLIKKRLIMMNSESRSNSLKYLAIFPVLLVVLSLFSFDSYTIYLDTDGKEISLQQDTIPNGIVFDTIVMYDFNSKKEVQRIVAIPKGKNAYLLPGNDPISKAMQSIDTIMMVDYDTYKETTVVINYKTGVIDTLVKE
jgi:beta-lactamase regulating signal transducer with metallopeptidase domain